MKKRDRTVESFQLLIVCIVLVIIPIAVVAQDEEVTINETEILWDSWGVPHIYASQPADLFYAFGWAQLKSHGNLILQLYGEARGRAAEYWGKEHFKADRNIHMLGVPERSVDWYTQLPADSKEILDAFVLGMNEFADSHPNFFEDSVKVVLPITPTDVLSHIQRVVHLTFMVRNPQNPGKGHLGELGSNGWAVGPSKSASQKSMLLINPHVPWSGLFIWYEAHLNLHELNTYGATLVGTPIIAVGFNKDLGWTHTVNTIDNVDHYELTLTDGGYLWDGKTKPFDVEKKILKVKMSDGALHDKPVIVTRSIHGPVVSQEKDKAVAIRVAGFDQPDMIGQYWDMIRARNLGEFESAIGQLQMPIFNVIYADRDGHIMYLFNGQVPKRPANVGDWDYWSGYVPGNSSATLWQETHAYEELPRIVDPPSGWVQNANDAPWTATFPQILNPDAYPSYMSPQEMGLRPQRSVQMLMEDASITYEELNTYKHSTQMLMADRLLDDLFEAAETYGTNATEALQVLRNWDRKADNDSRGAALFHLWVTEAGGHKNIFAIPWDKNDPLHTPDGLKNPEQALIALETATFKLSFFLGALDVTWGEINKVQNGDQEYPSNGAEGHFGVFRVAWHKDLDADQKFENVGGDSFYGLVEFSDPLKAKVLLPYGNSSQPGSPHRGDQLELYSNKEMRSVWFTIDEVNEHLEYREVLSKLSNTEKYQ